MTIVHQRDRGSEGQHALPSESLAVADERRGSSDGAVTSWRSGPWVMRRGIGPFLLGLDLVAVTLGVLGVELAGRESGFDSASGQVAVFGVILIVLMWPAGLYRSRLTLSLLDDLPSIAGRWLAAASLAVLLQVILRQDYTVDRRLILGGCIIGAVVLLLRPIAYWIVRRQRSARVITYRTLVVGAGHVGNHVVGILQDHPEYGLHPVGFLDEAPRARPGGAGLAVLGSPSELAAVLSAHQIRAVIVAFSSMKESEMVRIIRTCDRLRCELFVVPRLFELHQVRDEVDNAWGLPLVRLRRATHRSSAWRVKRIVDVAVAGGALVFLAPVLLLIALAVRIETGPGVLFRQERVGVDGRTFDVLKFRSLRPANEIESATKWNVAHDDRLGSVGRFLRRTSLDELPQLYNILRGDMSLVGPRPERRHFVEQFRRVYPSYEARHRVPSGLTGWAQVHGLRGDTSIADRARFDNYYIENWSLWLDLKIIIRTFGSVFRGSGA